MKRLTILNGIEEYEAVECMNCGQEKAGEQLENCGYCSCWQSVLNRLAAYEDIFFDENGNEIVSMEELQAMIKNMQQKGAESK